MSEARAAPPIYLVRHGETDWNAQGRLQGRKDIPLNPLGRVQAEEAGRRIADLVEDLATLDFVASPLGRTRETMAILRRTLALPETGFQLDETFVELTFGTWEGLTWREVRKSDPAGAARRERDKWGFVPPQGESYAMLADRIRPAVSRLDRPTVLVSHGGVARALLALLSGVPEADAPRVDIWQGRVLLIENGRHRWA